MNPARGERGAPRAGPALRAFRHVIWDWNGTLFDDAWLCVEVMNGVLRRRGFPPLTAARYEELFDFPVRRYYERLGFDFKRETFEEVGSEFMRGYEARRLECGLQSFARAAVEAAAEAGLTQSVLSGYRYDTLEELLAHFALRPFFVAVHGGDDHYAEGKETQAARWSAEAGVSPDATVLIGDTVHDGEIARRLGVACRLVPAGHQSRARLARCGVPMLGSLRELLAA